MNINSRLAVPGDFEFLRTNSNMPPDRIHVQTGIQGIIIAESDGVPAGYLWLTTLWYDVPLILFLWVLEEYRRQGIGKSLLRFAEETLREQGRKILYSSSVVTEVPPQEWHRHVGFEECGIISGLNVGGVGEIFFRKRL